MNKQLLCAALACLACSAGAASAQQAPAQRYIDAQGVEIIQNRDAARPVSATAAAQPRAGAVRTPAAATAAADPKLQVSATEQSARDLDRAAILREELAQEMRKFEAASKALVQGEQAARAQPEAGSALPRLKEILHTHQQNIEAISAELRRVPR